MSTEMEYFLAHVNFEDALMLFFATLTVGAIFTSVTSWLGCVTWRAAKTEKEYILRIFMKTCAALLHAMSLCAVGIFGRYLFLLSSTFPLEFAGCALALAIIVTWCWRLKVYKDKKPVVPEPY